MPAAGDTFLRDLSTYKGKRRVSFTWTYFKLDTPMG